MFIKTTYESDMSQTPIVLGGIPHVQLQDVAFP